MTRWVDDANLALLTDLYELTMAGAYLADGSAGTAATFELAVRSLPPVRNFLVAAGVDDALDSLQAMRFGPEALGYLHSLDRFPAAFLEHLEAWRFAADVSAVPEGEVVFGAEPLLRVRGPLIDAQIVETLLLNTVGFQTMVASKAARVGIAAAGRPFVDFGARRSHGADAALRAARAAYVGGAAATSMVLAGALFGIPVTGTMAHSYVMGHRSEHEAFTSFARTYPGDAVLLIDTYDTLEGARVAVEAARELAAEGIEVQGVRLDSGDLGSLAAGVRGILDDAGLNGVRIFASGGLDEHRVAALVERGAPIDAFGVGTAMVVSDDAPSLDIVYKMVERGGDPVMKTSPGKVSLPGAHQVWRRASGGRLDGDTIALEGEEVPGVPLLSSALEDGRRVRPPAGAEAAAERCRRGVAALPDRLRSLGPADPSYPVEITAALAGLAARVGGEPLDWPPDHPDSY